MLAEITFTFEGATITLHPNTLRRRETARQISAKLAETSLSPQTRSEFSMVVARTKSVTGGWQPPNPQADKRELEAAIEEWLDEVSPDLADEWLTQIYPTKPTPQK